MTQYTIDSVQSTEISIDNGKVQMKIGFSKKEFLEKDVRFVYTNFLSSSNMSEVIVHTSDSAGKTKNYKFYASPDDPKVDEFLGDLVSRLGKSIDLRGKDSKEALAQMKAMNTNAVAMIAVPAFVILVLIGFFSPLILHGFDGGNAEVTAEELKEGNKTGTSNLTISGHALSEAMEYSTRRKGTTTVRIYFPLVSENWESGQPVHILVETGKLSDEEFNEVISRTRFTGVLRDKLWEGPHSDVTKFFTENYGATFSEPVLLLDLDASAGEDRNIALFAIAFSILLFVGIGAYIKFKS